MFANYLQNECITLKKIGHGGGANFTHMNSSPKQIITTADDKLFTEDCITVQYDK